MHLFVGQSTAIPQPAITIFSLQGAAGVLRDDLD